MMTKMNSYKQAAVALREAVITALRDEDFDKSTLCELWRHFLGVQAIAEKLSKEEKSAAVSSLYDPDYNISDNLYNFGVAADTGSTFSFTGVGDDVIKF